MKATLKKITLVSFWVLLGFGLAYLFFYRQEMLFEIQQVICYE